MFERAHHQRIARVLRAFNADLLAQADCFFAGGTAIVLELGEYRESLDIDFLCASNEGYRLLRNTVTPVSLGALLNEPIPHLREVRADRYGIRTVLQVDDLPIKVELVSEGRIAIRGARHPRFGVPILSRVDMYAEKLLANADRGLDTSTLSRDMIDLAMMIQGWGAIPAESWDKAIAAYGEHVIRAYQTSLELVSDRSYLKSCLQKMQMEDVLLDIIPKILKGMPCE